MILATGKRGFTLIELLFITAIIGILIGVSLPNFRRTFNNFQLNSFTRNLQSFMIYLHQRSIVEGKMVFLNIDNQKNAYWAQIKDEDVALKTYQIPKDLNVESEPNEIPFYPDGTIDTASIKITNIDNQSIILTTEGILGGVKLQTQ